MGKEGRVHEAGREMEMGTLGFIVTNELCHGCPCAFHIHNPNQIVKHCQDEIRFFSPTEFLFHEWLWFPSWSVLVVRVLLHVQRSGGNCIKILKSKILLQMR